MKPRLVLVKLDPDEFAEVEPLFESLDEMCGALHIDDATKERIREGMEFSAAPELPEPGESIH